MPRIRPRTIGVLLGLVALAPTLTGCSADSIASSPRMAVARWAAGEGFRVQSGQYVGTGAGQPITGIGFQPELVIVKANGSLHPVFRQRTMPGAFSKPSTSAALVSDAIVSLDADGFSVGTNTAVSSNGVTFYWVAFRAGSGTFAVGSYVGDGAASQDVGGVGFEPGVAVVFPESSDPSVWRHALMPADAQKLSANTIGQMPEPDSLLALLPDGFRVGSSASVNSAGVEYHYFAARPATGSIHVSSYPGDGVAGHEVLGLGFNPTYLFWGGGSNSTHHKSAALPGSDYQSLSNSGHVAAIDFITDGFRLLGTGATTNAAGSTYYYFAFADPAASSGATRLGFTTQPSQTVAGAFISPGVAVAIQDGTGATVTSSTANVTLAIGTNPDTGVLSGTQTIAAVNGVATFADLSIDQAGTGYTLTASSGGLTGATSSAFDVIPGAAAQLMFVSPTVASPVPVGAASDVTIEVRDALGNRVTGYSGTIQFTSSDALASLPAQYTFQPGDSGRHTFPAAVSFSSFGSHSLTVRDVLSPSVSGTLTLQVQSSQGGACSAPADCQSGFCVGLVCCDTACQGNACLACNLSGTVGTCSVRRDDAACQPSSLRVGCGCGAPTNAAAPALTLLVPLLAAWAGRGKRRWPRTRKG